MKNLALFIALVHALPFFAQEAGVLLSPAQLKEDFLLVANTLEQQHPSTYRYVSRDSMQRSISAVIAQLNEPLSSIDFHLVVRRFITQVHCGHTVAMPAASWYTEMGKSANMPLKPIVSGNKLYFATAISSDSLSAGKEILSINGRKSVDILNDMRAIHTRDGFSGTALDYYIEDLFQTYHLFLYGNAPEYSITYQDGNQIASTLVRNKADITSQFPTRQGSEAYRLAFSASWTNLYINGADSLAIIRIKGFDRSHFRKNYRKMFREIRKQPVKHLAIDLRDNGGGYFPNGNTLLSYLTKEKIEFRFSRPNSKEKNGPHLQMKGFSRMTRSLFKLLPDPVDSDSARTYAIRYKPKTKKHFGGQVYVLTNGGSFSMSGYVTAFLKHRANAILIGQETGGGEEGSNGLLFQVLTLPNSGVRVHLPYFHLDHQLQGIASNRGIMPDVPVNYTVDDILNGKDLELEALLSEIRKRHASK